MSCWIYGVFTGWFLEKYLEDYTKISKRIILKFNENYRVAVFISASNSEFLLPFSTEPSNIL
jgi:membrane-bound acyltransferase YfiQ involved in biofilm formation